MRKIELTERMAVGLAGALRLLDAGGWPPERVSPFIREISTLPDKIKIPHKRDEVKVVFWFIHSRKNLYTIVVTVENVLQGNRFRWKPICAEGHPGWGFRCLFDEKGQAYNIEGEAPFLRLVDY